MLRTSPALLGPFLYAAVKAKELVKVVKSYLEQGANPNNYTASNGNTALHEAVIADEPRTRCHS